MNARLATLENDNFNIKSYGDEFSLQNCNYFDEENQIKQTDCVSRWSEVIYFQLFCYLCNLVKKNLNLLRKLLTKVLTTVSILYIIARTKKSSRRHLSPLMLSL